VLVNVSDSGLVLLTGTLEKLRVESLVLNAPGGLLPGSGSLVPGLLVPGLELTAVADTGTFTTELGLSLVTATVPLALPAACAVKVTEKGFRCPGDRVSGKVSPLILKPRPVMVACLTVTFVPPEFTSATDCVMLAPIFTLPRERTAGEALSWPATVAVPVMVMVSKGLEASDTTEIEPGALPPALGAKATPKVKLCPGLRVRGNANPVTL
jgi:hypothetical protein